MLLIRCPVCGAEGDETDFHYGGEGHLRRPATHDPEAVTDEAQRDYLYARRNPKGLHFERWRCDRGCGKWFHAARDTVTLQFRACYGITELPPAELIEEARTGPWAGAFPDPAPRKTGTAKTRKAGSSGKSSKSGKSNSSAKSDGAKTAARTPRRRATS
ncbi:sarcosine oxidase subunit delta [Kaustia mangrovi]|uniref:Sarcosine oxidase subunit delta n=1 Tax=Kaustia mangrovi TaxID=2593653 RepID=A0A7S8C254_9HYPH|nr:sarcosine oxidase subunit delta [Kaustia mangrovi]QPC41976.1 sarcosine oxidase subunit delta [Kaustia mangrovi]